ncbi:MAG: hypothetical protein IJA81_06755 [Akkermansia sp.]|nr:hypothetical protein [Akkermansia sp.]
MTTENQQEYQGYRMLTVIMPLNLHRNPQGRQRNMKLHHLLRLRSYQLRCYYYLMAPHSGVALRHGALCFRFKRQFKIEALLEQEWLNWLTESLLAEALCPCIFVYDDSGVGNATHLATIPITANAPLPTAPTLLSSELGVGKNMDPAHVPVFAFQRLIIPANTPVQDIHPTPESYNSWFNVNVDFT